MIAVGTRTTRWLVALATALTMLLSASPATASGDRGERHFRPGAPGVGDEYFPLAGNGGYNVAHYHLRLGYEPEGNHMRATVRIAAKGLSSNPRSCG